MGLRSGYKQTDIGLVPEDWKVVQVGDIAEFANGKPYESSVDPSGRYNLITLDSIGIDGQLKREHRKVDFLDHSLQKNDIVIILSDLAHGNLLGLCDLIPSDDNYVLNQRVGRLRPTSGSDPQFLRLQINLRQSFFKKRGQGTSQRHIYKRDIAALQIPLPPLPEQEAIAAVLSDVDALISGLDRLIAKKRAIKQGTMQQLLTGKTRLPGCSEEWETKSLGEIAAVIDPHPSHRAPKVDRNGIPFVGIGDIDTDGSINYETARFVSERVFDEHSERYSLADQLLGIGRVASIGKVVRLLRDIGKYAVSPTIAVIKPLEVRSDILFYCLLGQATSDQFNRIKSGSTRQAVGIMVLRDIELRLPKSSEEQEAIATILREMDAEITALEQRRDKTRALKQGMMQELLTGKTRLV